MEPNEQAPRLRVVPTSNGKFGVVGETYGVRLVLRSHGGRWYPPASAWAFETEEKAREALADAARYLPPLRAADRPSQAPAS